MNTRHVLRRTQCAGGEYFPAGNAVRQRDDFVVTGKDNIMIAADGAASDGMNPDFIFGTGLADGVPVVNILAAF